MFTSSGGIILWAATAHSKSFKEGKYEKNGVLSCNKVTKISVSVVFDREIHSPRDTMTILAPIKASASGTSAPGPLGCFSPLTINLGAALFILYTCNNMLKGHWTSITSSPDFDQKRLDFIPLEVLALVMTHADSYFLVWVPKKCEYS